jgi:hypothetical protein
MRAVADPSLFQFVQIILFGLRRLSDLALFPKKIRRNISIPIVELQVVRSAIVALLNGKTQIRQSLRLGCTKGCTVPDFRSSSFVCP